MSIKITDKQLNEINEEINVKPLVNTAINHYLDNNEFKSSFKAETHDLDQDKTTDNGLLELEFKFKHEGKVYELSLGTEFDVIADFETDYISALDKKEVSISDFYVVFYNTNLSILTDSGYEVVTDYEVDLDDYPKFQQALKENLRFEYD